MKGPQRLLCYYYAHYYAPGPSAVPPQLWTPPCQHNIYLFNVHFAHVVSHPIRPYCGWVFTGGLTCKELQYVCMHAFHTDACMLRPSTALTERKLLFEHAVTHGRPAGVLWTTLGIFTTYFPSLSTATAFPLLELKGYRFTTTAGMTHWLSRCTWWYWKCSRASDVRVASLNTSEEHDGVEMNQGNAGEQNFPTERRAARSTRRDEANSMQGNLSDQKYIRKIQCWI